MSSHSPWILLLAAIICPALIHADLCWKPGSNPFYGQPKALRVDLEHVHLEWAHIFGGSGCQNVDFMIKSHPRFKPSQYKLSDFTLKAQRSALVKVEKGVDYVFQIIARENKGPQLGIDYKYSPMVTSYATDFQGPSVQIHSSQNGPPITHETTRVVPPQTPSAYQKPQTRALTPRDQSEDTQSPASSLSKLDHCLPVLNDLNGFGHGSQRQKDRIIVNFIRYMNRQPFQLVQDFLATKKGCDASHHKGYLRTCQGQTRCCSSPWSSCEETGAQSSCSVDFANCDGRCIPQKWVGDGWPDCLDGSDEISLQSEDRHQYRAFSQDLTCLHCSAVVLSSISMCSNSGQGVSHECVEDMMGSGGCNDCIQDFLPHE
ncbi:uncharacterized protein LOC131884564 [Tigriopus californicus]|uniref:uncharacterized protein LOC131884564 n=1 Tax=Tigriopus californicus TaxID=6832 RepID=UPI0027DA7E67|nr:uncharacterized protein LOC131884564 [Tigriopus californicus]